MKWPEVIEALRREAPFATQGGIIKRARDLRGKETTADAIYGAWRRCGAEGTVGDLLGRVDDWEEDTIPERPGLLTPPGTRMHRPSLRIEPPRGPVLVPGDLHFPVNDTDSTRAMLELAHDVGVAAVVLHGDTLDNAGMSRFPTSPDSVQLADELTSVKWFWTALRQLGCPVYIMGGNHELGRWQRFVEANPWLYQHPSIDWRSIFQIPEWATVLEPDTRLRFGPVCIEHGHNLKGVGRQYSAAAVYRNHPRQITVFGHTHRQDRFVMTCYDEEGRQRTYGAYSVGHLQRLDSAGYADDPNWQAGFGLLEPSGDWWQIHQVQIHGGRFSFGGRAYG